MQLVHTIGCYGPIALANMRQALISCRRCKLWCINLHPPVCAERCTPAACAGPVLLLLRLCADADTRRLRHLAHRWPLSPASRRGPLVSRNCGSASAGGHHPRCGVGGRPGPLLTLHESYACSGQMPSTWLLTLVEDAARKQDSAAGWPRSHLSGLSCRALLCPGWGFMQGSTVHSVFG